jgi:hypothetical protein
MEYIGNAGENVGVHRLPSGLDVRNGSARKSHCPRQLGLGQSLLFSSLANLPAKGAIKRALWERHGTFVIGSKVNVKYRNIVM